MRGELTTSGRVRSTRARLRPLWLSVVLVALLLVGGVIPSLARSSVQADATSKGGVTRWLDQPTDSRPQLAPTVVPGPTHTYVYLAAIHKGMIYEPILEEEYHTLSVFSAPTDRPAEEHADLNLALRGYEPIGAQLDLVDYGGGSDPYAPQLPGLFGDLRTPVFDEVCRVYDWNWGCNCRGGLNTQWEVTLAGLATEFGEKIHVPTRGQSIGSGYEVLVLYAAPDHITLKYTREDNVVWGYTLHVENVYVEPRLLELYRLCDAAGRGHLPALRDGQAFGRAQGGEFRVAIRDCGSFMDPRSRKDWWQGR